MFEPGNVLLNRHSKFSPPLAQRLNVMIVLLLLAFVTTSCGMPAHAAGAQAKQNNLNLYGNLPSGTVSQTYNAVLSVSGGSSPYYFSVKSGTLPPGVSLNPATGTFSGTPTTSGTYAFQVIVTDSPLLDQGSQSFMIAVAATGGGSGGGGGSVQVSVSPTSVTLFSQGKQQFTASVSGTSNTAVTWSATAGSVDGNGL